MLLLTAVRLCSCCWGLTACKLHPGDQNDGQSDVCLVSCYDHLAMTSSKDCTLVAASLIVLVGKNLVAHLVSTRRSQQTGRMLACWARAAWEPHRSVQQQQLMKPGL